MAAIVLLIGAIMGAVFTAAIFVLHWWAVVVYAVLVLAMFALIKYGKHIDV